MGPAGAAVAWAEWQEVSMTHIPSDRMNTTEAAKYTGLSQSTLTKLRVFGGGPRFIKARRSVLYDRPDLDEWLNARKHASTSEYANA